MYQPEHLGKCMESEMISWRTFLRYLRYDLKGEKVNQEKGRQNSAHEGPKEKEA